MGKRKYEVDNYKEEVKKGTYKGQTVTALGNSNKDALLFKNNPTHARQAMANKKTANKKTKK